MAGFLYTIGMYSFQGLISIVSLFNPKAKAWLAGRKNQFKTLQEQLAGLDPNRPTVWFHASSLGEFEQGRPVMELMKSKTKCHLVLTFYSPSGYEKMKGWEGADVVSYLPLDTPKNAKRMADMIHPVGVVFIKYEYWYHLLYRLAKNHIPVFYISARFYPSQAFFKPWGKVYRRVLKMVTFFYLQDEDSAKLLSSININNYTVTGDSRYDRVSELSLNKDRFPVIESFAEDKPVFIAGSSWPSDEKIICRFINQYPNLFRYVLAPHDIGEKHLNEIEDRLKVGTCRYSKPDTCKENKVLIIDTIGQLSRIYKYATLSFIGGGFKEGLHNILEPAAYGIPVITGPDQNGFPEAKAMQNEGGLLTVSSFDDFERTVIHLVENQEDYQKAAHAGRSFVNRRKGASARIASELIKKMNG